MTTARTIHAIVLFLVLTVGQASRAISGNGGSAYSRFGFGEIRYFPSERSAGMGGTTIALLPTNSMSNLNPASWTQLTRTRFALGASYEGFFSKDGSASSFLSGASFNGVVLAVPISTDNGIVLGAGLTPYSTTNYTVVANVSDAATMSTYTLTQSGDGGLSNAHLGLSLGVGKDWHFGAKLNYLFGTIKQRTTQTFLSSSSELTRETRFSGAGGTIGLIYSGTGKLLHFEDSQSLSFGLVFSTGVRLSTERENRFEYLAGGSQIGGDTLNAGEGTSSVPLALGLGVSFNSKEKFALAADFYYQNWNQATLLGVHPAELRDSYRIGLGGEVSPHRESSAEFLQKVAYRFGMFYHATNLRVSGQGINEIGLTTGVGLPMFGDNRFNIGIEYSIRGTTANNLQKDNIIRVSFTLNAGELWFVRPADE